MNSDEPPTRRDSGQLAVFEQTARDALARLEAIGVDARIADLIVEARALLNVFENWKTAPLFSEERTQLIERVIDLHRSVEVLLSER